MVTPQDFLSVAQGIAARKSIQEIQARTAASRAYYAVFHLLVRELDIDFRLAAGGVHEIVRTEVLARPSSESTLVQVAKPLFESLRAEGLREQREAPAAHARPFVRPFCDLRGFVRNKSVDKPGAA